MSVNFWQDIDAYISTAVTADMGVGSGYATLQIQDVIDTALWQPDLWTLPAVAYNGDAVRAELAYHESADEVHLESTYPYVLAAVVKATASDSGRTNYASAKADAKELGRRLREIFRTRYKLGGLTSTDGEYIVDTQIRGLQVFVFPVEGSTRAWFGTARLELDIHSEI